MPHRTKLAADQVVPLRQRYAQGDVGYEDLAAEYGVHWHTIARAVTGQTWKQLPGAVPSRPKGKQLRKRRKGRPGGTKLTWEQADEIRQATISQAELARQYGVSPSTVNDIKHGRHWVPMSEPS